MVLLGTYQHSTLTLILFAFEKPLLFFFIYLIVNEKTQWFKTTKIQPKLKKLSFLFMNFSYIVRMVFLAYCEAHEGIQNGTLPL